MSKGKLYAWENVDSPNEYSIPMKEDEVEDWLGCPSSVKEALPKKIKNAVMAALDECFLERVGSPEAQKDKWLYKEIKKRVCAAMDEWVKEALDEAMEKALGK